MWSMPKPSFKPPEPIYVLTHAARDFLAEHRVNLPPGIIQGRRLTLPEDRLCNAPIIGGTDKCRNFAGYKTMHSGTGPCFRHDSFNHFSRKLLLDFVESERLMGVYGSPLDIDPHTALLMEVQRTAGHVEWLRQLVNDIHEAQQGEAKKIDISLVQYTPMGIQPSVWIQMYQEERKHLIRVCEAAIKAGVAEKTVQIAQEQAQMLAMVLKGFLLDNRMDFTPQQRILAPTVIRELISGVGAPVEVAFPSDEPVVVETKAVAVPKAKATPKAKGKAK